MIRSMFVVFWSVLLLISGCGDSGGVAQDVVVEADTVVAAGFVRLSDSALGGVLHVGAVGCRDDAIFVSVGAAEATGIYKMELDSPELGWRQIYDQEALLHPTSEALAVALPPGKS
jgi:hypothetical protein